MSTFLTLILRALTAAGSHCMEIVERDLFRQLQLKKLFLYYNAYRICGHRLLGSRHDFVCLADVTAGVVTVEVVPVPIVIVHVAAVLRAAEAVVVIGLSLLPVEESGILSIHPLPWGIICVVRLVQPNPYRIIAQHDMVVDALILCLVCDGGQGATKLLAIETCSVEV